MTDQFDIRNSVFGPPATPDTGRKFTELYNVQHLTSNHLDPVARVTICTIQRLYAMLRGFVFWFNNDAAGPVHARRQAARFPRSTKRAEIASLCAGLLT